MRFFLTILALLCCTAPLKAAPTRVLIYTHNGKGYVHENIQASVDAMTLIASRHGFQVDVSDDPTVFTPQNLTRYAGAPYLA